MSHLSHREINNILFNLHNSNPNYFGLKDGYLDMHTMRYRIFGAVWKLAEGRKYILGYWFADHENDIHMAIQNAGFTNIIKTKKMI
ncbi:hypothetical protein [Bacillus salipaludis]|uniref:hypothetical protein n=1 Tax=Bacillus salipaludis TaxID=2547811 RepID=UPI002E1A9402|nr:hypothetical protein [Bacillus salipaludis]